MRARWRSRFPPWIVNTHGPAWKPALSRDAPAHLVSPFLPRCLCVAIQVQSAGKSRAGKPSARRPAPPSDWAGCPALGSFSFTVGLSFPGRRSLACPSLLPQRPGRAEGSEGAAGPTGCGSWPWKGFLAAPPLPADSGGGHSTLGTQHPTLKGLVPPPALLPVVLSSPEHPPAPQPH